MSKCRLCRDSFNSGIGHMIVHLARKLDDEKTKEEPCKNCGTLTIFRDDKKQPECLICYKALHNSKSVEGKEQ